MGSLTVRVQLVPRLPGELCTERSALFNVPVVSSGASLEVAGESLDALRRHCNSGKNEIAQAVQDLAGEFRISPQEIFNKEGDVVNALAKHSRSPNACFKPGVHVPAPCVPVEDGPDYAYLKPFLFMYREEDLPLLRERTRRSVPMVYDARELRQQADNMTVLAAISELIANAVEAGAQQIEIAYTPGRFDTGNVPTLMFTDKGSGAWTDQLQSMFTVGRHGANENNFEGALDNNLQPMAFLVRTALGKYGKGAKLAMCFLGRKCDATSHKQSGLSIFTYGADFEDWFEDVNCATGNYMMHQDVRFIGEHDPEFNTSRTTIKMTKLQESTILQFENNGSLGQLITQVHDKFYHFIHGVPHEVFDALPADMQVGGRPSGGLCIKFVAPCLDNGQVLLSADVAQLSSGVSPGYMHVLREKHRARKRQIQGDADGTAGTAATSVAYAGADAGGNLEEEVMDLTDDAFVHAAADAASPPATPKHTSSSAQGTSSRAGATAGAAVHSGAPRAHGSSTQAGRQAGAGPQTAGPSTQARPSAAASVRVTHGSVGMSEEAGIGAGSGAGQPCAGQPRVRTQKNARGARAPARQGGTTAGAGTSSVASTRAGADAGSAVGTSAGAGAGAEALKPFQVYLTFPQANGQGRVHALLHMDYYPAHEGRSTLPVMPAGTLDMIGRQNVDMWKGLFCHWSGVLLQSSSNRPNPLIQYLSSLLQQGQQSLLKFQASEESCRNVKYGDYDNLRIVSHLFVSPNAVPDEVKTSLKHTTTGLALLGDLWGVELRLLQAGEHNMPVSKEEAAKALLEHAKLYWLPHEHVVGDLVEPIRSFRRCMRTQDGQDIDCEIDCADACMLHMGNKSQITKFDIVKLKTRRSKRESENVHQPNVYYLLRVERWPLLVHRDVFKAQLLPVRPHRKHQLSEVQQRLAEAASMPSSGLAVEVSLLDLDLLGSKAAIHSHNILRNDMEKELPVRMVWAGETRCHLHIPEPSPITAATPAPGTSPTAPTCGGSALDTNFSFKDPLHVLLCTKGNHTAGEDKLSKYGFNCMLSAVLKQQDSSGGWSTELWKRQGIKRDVGAGSQFSFRVVDGSGQPLRLEQGTYRLSVMVQDPDSWFVAFTHKLSLEHEFRVSQQHVHSFQPAWLQAYENERLDRSVERRLEEVLRIKLQQFNSSNAQVAFGPEYESDDSCVCLSAYRVVQSGSKREEEAVTLGGVLQRQLCDNNKELHLSGMFVQYADKLMVNAKGEPDGRLTVYLRVVLRKGAGSTGPAQGSAGGSQGSQGVDGNSLTEDLKFELLSKGLHAITVQDEPEDDRPEFGWKGQCPTEEVYNGHVGEVVGMPFGLTCLPPVVFIPQDQYGIPYERRADEPEYALQLKVEGSMTVWQSGRAAATRTTGTETVLLASKPNKCDAFRMDSTKAELRTQTSKAGDVLKLMVTLVRREGGVCNVVRPKVQRIYQWKVLPSAVHLGFAVTAADARVNMDANTDGRTMAGPSGSANGQTTSEARQRLRQAHILDTHRHKVGARSSTLPPGLSSAFVKLWQPQGHDADQLLDPSGEKHSNEAAALQHLRTRSPAYTVCLEVDAVQEASEGRCPAGTLVLRDLCLKVLPSYEAGALPDETFNRQLKFLAYGQDISAHATVNQCSQGVLEDTGHLYLTPELFSKSTVPGHAKIDIVILASAAVAAASSAQQRPAHVPLCSFWVRPKLQLHHFWLAPPLSATGLVIRSRRDAQVPPGCCLAQHPACPTGTLISSNTPPARTTGTSQAGNTAALFPAWAVQSTGRGAENAAVSTAVPLPYGCAWELGHSRSSRCMPMDMEAGEVVVLDLLGLNAAFIPVPLTSSSVLQQLLPVASCIVLQPAADADEADTREARTHGSAGDAGQADSPFTLEGVEVHKMPAAADGDNGWARISFRVTHGSGPALLRVQPTGGLPTMQLPVQVVPGKLHSAQLMGLAAGPAGNLASTSKPTSIYQIELTCGSAQGFSLLLTDICGSRVSKVYRLQLVQALLAANARGTQATAPTRAKWGCPVGFFLSTSQSAAEATEVLIADGFSEHLQLVMAKQEGLVGDHRLQLRVLAADGEAGPSERGGGRQAQAEVLQCFEVQLKVIAGKYPSMIRLAEGFIWGPAFERVQLARAGAVAVTLPHFSLSVVAPDQSTPPPSQLKAITLAWMQESGEGQQAQMQNGEEDEQSQEVQGMPVLSADESSGLFTVRDVPVPTLVGRYKLVARYPDQPVEALIVGRTDVLHGPHAGWSVQPVPSVHNLCASSAESTLGAVFDDVVLDIHQQVLQHVSNTNCQVLDTHSNVCSRADWLEAVQLHVRFRSLGAVIGSFGAWRPVGQPLDVQTGRVQWLAGRLPAAPELLPDGGGAASYGMYELSLHASGALKGLGQVVVLKFTYSSGHDAELRIQRSGLEAERQSAQKAKDDAAKALAAAAEKLMVAQAARSTADYERVSLEVAKATCSTAKQNLESQLANLASERRTTSARSTQDGDTALLRHILVPSACPRPSFRLARVWQGIASTGATPPDAHSTLAACLGGSNGSTRRDALINLMRAHLPGSLSLSEAQAPVTLAPPVLGPCLALVGFESLQLCRLAALIMGRSASKVVTTTAAADNDLGRGPGQMLNMTSMCLTDMYQARGFFLDTLEGDPAHRLDFQPRLLDICQALLGHPGRGFVQRGGPAEGANGSTRMFPINRDLAALEMQLVEQHGFVGFLTNLAVLPPALAAMRVQLQEDYRASPGYGNNAAGPGWYTLRQSLLYLLFGDSIIFTTNRQLQAAIEAFRRAKIMPPRMYSCEQQGRSYGRGGTESFELPPATLGKSCALVTASDKACWDLEQRKDRETEKGAGLTARIKSARERTAAAEANVEECQQERDRLRGALDAAEARLAAEEKRVHGRVAEIDLQLTMLRMQSRRAEAPLGAAQANCPANPEASTGRRSKRGRSPRTSNTGSAQGLATEAASEGVNNEPASSQGRPAGLRRRETASSTDASIGRSFGRAAAAAAGSSRGRGGNDSHASTNMAGSQDASGMSVDGRPHVHGTAWAARGAGKATGRVAAASADAGGSQAGGVPAGVVGAVGNVRKRASREVAVAAAAEPAVPAAPKKAAR